MRNWLKKYVDPAVPLYTILPLVTCLSINCVVYFMIRLFTADAYHYDFTTSFDRMVPFEPAWVSVYLVCYIFWIYNYILIMRQSKEHCYRFVTADILSRLVCGVFFLFMPTTNVRPEIIGNGIWENLMRWLYDFDAPTNLFPSIHCLVSWFCYVGIRGRKNIPAWYRAFSCIFALLVCVSTQFTKQHYVVDVFGGIILAEVLWALSRHHDWYKKVMPVLEAVSGKIFGKENI